MESLVSAAQNAARFLVLLDENILPPHLHATSGVNLQTYNAVGELRGGVIIIDNLHAIEMSNDVRPFY